MVQCLSEQASFYDPSDKSARPALGQALCPVGVVNDRHGGRLSGFRPALPCLLMPVPAVPRPFVPASWVQILCFRRDLFNSCSTLARLLFDSRSSCAPWNIGYAVSQEVRGSGFDTESED